MAHEVSVTFPMKTKAGKQVWVNASSVNPKGGKHFTEDEVRERVASGKQKAHSFSNSQKEAVGNARARSKQGEKAPAAAILIGDIMGE